MGYGGVKFVWVPGQHSFATSPEAQVWRVHPEIEPNRQGLGVLPPAPIQLGKLLDRVDNPSSLRVMSTEGPLPTLTDEFWPFAGGMFSSPT